MKIKILIVSLFFIAFQSCKKEETIFEPTDSPVTLELPSHFPEVEFPEDNVLTKMRIELGRRLFYDTRLSADNSISCGSCHLQELAFSDGQPTSVGIENRIGPRNTPSLGNVAYQERLFMEGGVPTLEIQVLAPIENEDEFDHDVNIIEADFLADDELNQLSLVAYEREIDLYVITRAISAFERTLITGNSKYDQFINGETSLTAQEELGKTLFFSEELNCGTCHSGHNFTDGDYHNLGLYLDYEDEGRFRVSNDAADIGKFKTPSLRNVELTAPYMHNGSISALEEVIEHLNSGGLGHENQSELIVPLNLTDAEKQALIAFLYSLTDYEFISNPDFAPID